MPTKPIRLARVLNRFPSLTGTAIIRLLGFRISCRRQLEQSEFERSVRISPAPGGQTSKVPAVIIADGMELRLQSALGSPDTTGNIPLGRSVLSDRRHRRRTCSPGPRARQGYRNRPHGAPEASCSRRSLRQPDCRWPSQSPVFAIRVQAHGGGIDRYGAVAGPLTCLLQLRPMWPQ